MKLGIKMVACLMSVMYWILKKLPTKRKIIFLSRQHDTSNVDFDLMIAYIGEMYPDYDCKVLAQRIKPGMVNMLKYGFHTLQQMYELATSEIAILDTYCVPVSLLHHKEELLVIQMWHAIGAFKKFGLSIVGKEEGSSEAVASYMKMHKNYDYVCASSEYCRPFFAEAFGVSVSQVVTYPLPRLDRLCQWEEQERIIRNIYRTYPQLLGGEKKVVVYAPTFRKGQEDMSETIQELIWSFDFCRYHLIIKEHPLSEIHVDDKRVIWDKEYETDEMILVADYVITDYSAIVFEAAVARKPILFYATDYDAYMKNRDFYCEYEQMIPGILLRSGHAVHMAMENQLYSQEQIEEFASKYVKKPEKSYTVDLVEFIMGARKSV